LIKLTGNRKTGKCSRKATNPDFSPTKFFAGRGAGHEAVVSYRKCSATKQLRKNLLARRVNFLIWNKIQSGLWVF